MARPQRNDNDNFFTPKNSLFYSAGIYRPLDAAKHEIRLLRILPDDPETQVECELVRDVYLSESPAAYHALSYAAGELSKTEPVKLNGITFNVFQRLESAMKQLRTRTDTLFWIDQICINQNDRQEKGHQVLMMREIYSTAAKTVIWLGDQSTPTAIVEFREQAAILRTFLDCQDLAELDETADYKLVKLFIGAATRSLAASPEKLTSTIQAMSDIFEQAWWKRCWKIQEVVLSRNTQIVWGQELMGYIDLRIMNQVLAYAYIRRQEASHTSGTTASEPWRQFASLSQAMSVYNLKSKWVLNHNLRLRDVLKISRNLMSTDPCDRVYAMLGLADPVYSIIPKYEPGNTTFAVLTAAVKAMIEHDHSLDILCDVGEKRRDHTLALPSWCPDFTHAIERWPLCDEKRGDKWAYDASWQENDGALYEKVHDQTRNALSAPPRFVKGSRILQCTGFDLGVVARVDSLGAIPDVAGGGTLFEIAARTRSRWLQCLDARGMHLGDRYSDNYTVASAFSDTLEFGLRIDDPRSIGQTERQNARVLGPVWRFFITPEMIMGMAPLDTRHDDRLFVLMGANVPFVLRPLENGSKDNLELVGQVYLHGCMHGKAVEEYETGKRSMVRINIH